MMPAHREVFFQSCQNKPNFEFNYTFQIDCIGIIGIVIGTELRLFPNQSE